MKTATKAAAANYFQDLSRSVPAKVALYPGRIDRYQRPLCHFFVGCRDNGAKGSAPDGATLDDWAKTGWRRVTRDRIEREEVSIAWREDY